MHMGAVTLGLWVAAGMAAPAYAAPLASKAAKFLGSAHGAQQAPGFAQHWNKLTGKNGGKWGSVEAMRDQMIGARWMLLTGLRRPTACRSRCT